MKKDTKFLETQTSIYYILILHIAFQLFIIHICSNNYILFYHNEIIPDIMFCDLFYINIHHEIMWATSGDQIYPGQTRKAEAHQMFDNEQVFIPMLQRDPVAPPG